MISPKTLDSIPDGYVLVKEIKAPKKEQDSKDSKTALSTVVAQPPVRLRALGAGGKYMKPIKVKLVSRYDLSSTAATPLTSVQALSPIAVQDFSGYAALYDLQRTLRVHVAWYAQSSGTINGSATYAVAMDPSNPGVYGSVADVLTAQHKAGPFVLGQNSNSKDPGLSMTASGFRTLDMSCIPTKITGDSATSNLVGGGWTATSNTTAIVGWFKPYVDSLGGALVSSITMYVTYYVEFKSRT